MPDGPPQAGQSDRRHGQRRRGDESRIGLGCDFFPRPFAAIADGTRYPRLEESSASPDRKGSARVGPSRCWPEASGRSDWS